MYIGNIPRTGSQQKLDTIVFDGSSQTFNMAVGGVAVYPYIYQLIISVGGVLQEPGVDFTILNDQITFTTLPTSDLSFFGVILGQYLDIGAPGDDTVSTVKLQDSAVTTVKIADGAITAAKIADGTIVAADIADGSVTTAKLADDAVTNAKIGASAVGSTELADTSVTEAKIANSAVTESKLGALSVAEAKIQASAVTTTKIADDAVTQAKIAAGAVGTTEIADDAVTNAKIGASAVGTTEIADDAVTNAKIGAGAVGTTEIADDAVTQAKIGAGAVGTTELADDGVTQAKIAAGAVGTTEIADANVTVAKLSTGAPSWDSSGNVTLTGYLAGPATFTIDPAAVGDDTGTVVIKGGLQVDGTTTTINSTTVSVDDLNITLADGAANAAAADGAGLTIAGASATLTYASTGDKWVFNKAPYYNTDRVLTTADEGSGNGLDADTLDGQQGTYYLAASTYTASDVLTKLLTVDGTGTNLDADLLDGQQGTYDLDYNNFSNTPTGIALTGSSNTFTAANTFQGRSDFQELREVINDLTVTSNAVTADYSTGTVFYIDASSASADLTANVTNLPTDNGNIINISFIVSQGSTGRIVGTFQIGGSGQTIKWAGAAAPTATSTSGAIDIFGFTLIRRSSSWTVIGAASKNFN
jgi:hypothetical protein